MQGYKMVLISSITVVMAFFVTWTTQTQAAATLVGQWEFDGDFTAANDSNYNGNPSGTVTFVPGQNGQAVSFDGGTGVGSYDPAIDKVDSVKLTSASEFNGGLSIMGWIKPDAFPGINEDIRGKVFLSHDQSCCGSQFMGFDFGIGSSGELIYWMNDFNDNRIWGKTSSGTIALGGWAHVAVTWDGNPSGGIQLYLNGAPVSTTLNFLNTFAGLNSTGLLPVRIGASFARSDNVIRGFDGSIDHISVWKGALSAEAILADYNNTRNTAPVANAGPDQPAHVGHMVTLDGSGSTDADGDPLTYAWTFISKPIGSNAILNNPTSVNPSFTPDKIGEYEVSLTVNDGKVPNEPPSPIATINTVNSCPIACIQTPSDDVRVGNVVMLDGSCSRDPDEDLIIYSWAFVSKPIGSNAELSDPTAVSPTFVADKSGSYVVSLVVNDGTCVNMSEPVTISTRNVSPVADAGPDQLIIEIGSTVCLDGTQSYDPDGDDITYQWSFTSKPDGSNASLENADTPTPCFVADVRGDYIIQLAVTDPSGANDTDCVKVSFDNLKPVAHAGTGGAVVVGKPFTLDGSGSMDANGDDLTYKWSFTSVPAGSQCTIQDPIAMTTTFVPDVAGTYVVQLVVNDGDLGSDPSSIQIQVITEQTAAIIAVQDCQEVIVLLDPAVFKNANMQNTMINKLNAVIANIEAGNYADALGQLQNDILKKTDGCANATKPDKNDWITTCPAQGSVYPNILIAIDAVEALMQ